MKTTISIAAVLLAASVLSAEPLAEGQRTAWVAVNASRPIHAFSDPDQDLTVTTYLDFGDPLVVIAEATVTVTLKSADIPLDQTIPVPVEIPSETGLQPPLTVPISVSIPDGQVDPVTVAASVEWTLELAESSDSMIAIDEIELYFAPPSEFGDAPQFDAFVVDGTQIEAAPGEEVEIHLLLANNRPSACHIMADVTTSTISSNPGGIDSDGLHVGLSPGEGVNAEVTDASAPSPPTGVFPVYDGVTLREGLCVLKVGTQVPVDATPGSAFRVNSVIEADWFQGASSELTVSAIVAVLEANLNGRQFVEMGKTGLFSQTEVDPGEFTFGDGSQQLLGDATRTRTGFGYPGWSAGADETETKVPVPGLPRSYEYRSTTVRGTPVGTFTHNWVKVFFSPLFEGPLEIPEVYIAADKPANVYVEIYFEFGEPYIAIYNVAGEDEVGALLFDMPLEEFYLYGTQNETPAVPTDVDFFPARDTCTTLSYTDPGRARLAADPPVVVGDGEDPLRPVTVLGGSGGGAGLPGDYTVAENPGVSTGIESLANGGVRLYFSWNSPPALTPAITRIDQWIEDASGSELTIPIFGRTPIGPPPPGLEVSKAKGVTRSGSVSQDSVKFIVRFVRVDDAANKKRPEDIPTECRDMAVDFAGHVTRFSLNARGKGKSADRRRSIKAKVKTDADGNQVIILKCRLKKQELFYRFSLFGNFVAGATIPRPGIQLAIPVRAVWCGQLFAGVADVVYTAKEGKRGRFKTPR